MGEAPPLRLGEARRADGTRLAVQESGPPDGPPLLLLQGQANAHAWWTGLRDDFPAYRAITFDYRGTGATVAEEDASWSTALFAEDAAAVLDACGVSGARVYGTSMGGRVGQLLAAQAPDRVSRLVLACTSPGGVLGLERDADVRRSLAQPDPAARRQALLDLMYTPAWFRPGRRSHLLGDPGMTRRAQGLHLRVSAHHDAVDHLPRVSAPTLLLHGDADRMAPVENAELIAGLVPDSRVVLVPGGRHGFFDEFRDEVSAVVRDFLA
jgi:pimeloyl-ACP methyl ester carboxylesterase